MYTVQCSVFTFATHPGDNTTVNGFEISERQNRHKDKSILHVLTYIP